MTNWFKFCKDKIEKIEKVWNRKLEDTSPDSDDDANDDDPESNMDVLLRNNEEDKDKVIGDMLRNIQNRRRENVQAKKGGSFVEKSDRDSDLDQAAKDAEASRSKDDTDLKQRQFSSNQYWSLPSNDEFDLADLMEEADGDDKPQTSTISEEPQQSDDAPADESNDSLNEPAEEPADSQGQG